MSDKDIIHGAKVHDDDSVGALELPSVATGVIIGTAPGADDDIFPYNKPILIVRDDEKLASLGSNGTLPTAINMAQATADAKNFLIRVADDEDYLTVINNILGNKALKTGIYALLDIYTNFGIRAQQVCVPYYTKFTVNDMANPIVAALCADDIQEHRFHIYADSDCPDYEAAVDYRQDFDCDRLKITATPWWWYDTATSAYVQKPASPIIMATQQRMMIERGVQINLSNKEVEVGGEPVYKYTHLFNSNNCETALMNSQDMIVFVKHPEGGWRTWGNTAATANANNMFSHVVQVLDYMAFAVEDYLIDWVDEDPNEKAFDDIESEINRSLIEPMAVGAPENRALIGGVQYNRFHFERELNDAGRARRGIWWWVLDCEPTGLLSGLNVQIRRQGAAAYEYFINKVAS